MSRISGEFSKVFARAPPPLSRRAGSAPFLSLFLDSFFEKNYNETMFQTLFQKLFPKAYYASPAYKRKAALQFDSKLLQYVTERRDTGDVVLCKDSYICVKAGYVYVNSEEKSIFKCRDDAVESGELMSRDGVIFTGFDEISGKVRSIICYFRYYR